MYNPHLTIRVSDPFNIPIYVIRIVHQFAEQISLTNLDFYSWNEKKSMFEKIFFSFSMLAYCEQHRLQ
jgi:hypothetical protein